MSRGNIARRIARLEAATDDERIRFVVLEAGDEVPEQRPGEHLIILRARDMGEA